jgi:hypothetical protein
MSDLSTTTDVVASVDAPAVVTAPAVPSLTLDQEKLLKIITEVVTKKPTTPAEALEIFGSLQVQLGTWLVSGLPAKEAKSLLMGLWAAEQLNSLNWTSCFGKK